MEIHCGLLEVLVGDDPACACADPIDTLPAGSNSSARGSVKKSKKETFLSLATSGLDMLVVDWLTIKHILNPIYDQYDLPFGS